jgi:hypothetical protein
MVATLFAFAFVFSFSAFLLLLLFLVAVLVGFVAPAGAGTAAAFFELRLREYVAVPGPVLLPAVALPAAFAGLLRRAMIGLGIW